MPPSCRHLNNFQISVPYGILFDLTKLEYVPESSGEKRLFKLDVGEGSLVELVFLYATSRLDQH